MSDSIETSEDMARPWIPDQGTNGQDQGKGEQSPLGGLFFNGAHILVSKRGTAAVSPDAPGSYVVAQLTTEGEMCDARVFAATGRCMAASAELLAGLEEALQIVEAFHGPVEWDTYWNFSPEMKRLRAIVAMATGSST